MVVLQDFDSGAGHPGEPGGVLQPVPALTSRIVFSAPGGAPGLRQIPQL